MIKKLLLSLSLLLIAGAAGAQYKDGYYNLMDGKKKEALKAAAKECVKDHKELIYNDLPDNWRWTDTYPERYNGAIRWWEMYSNNIYLISGNQSPKTSFSANKMQREHSVPKSWWKVVNDVEYTPAYTDLWNLLPSDGTCNQAKSNYPYGVVEPGTATFDNGSAKVGKPMSGTASGSTKVFEPADEYKGDFARGIFYMATVYDDLPWVNNTYDMFQRNSWPTLKSWAIETLMEWHRNDPVSQKEIDRNNAVEGQQGNRNPFIDFPNLAEFIWGNFTDQEFKLSEQGTQQAPIPDEAYIDMPVNNEALDFGQCAIGGNVVTYLEIKGMIREPLNISLSGTDRTMFRLETTSIAPTMLNTTQSIWIPVTFSPTTTGVKTANLLLYDGGISGSIRVVLRGEGCDVPQLSRLTAYDATDVTTESYVAHWSAAPQVVDYYVVTRTILGNEGTEIETLESNETSLKIMRTQNVAETYSVQSSRLGYLSEASNTVNVAEGTGIIRVDAPCAIEVETDVDGFRMAGDCESVDVRVYDLSGRMIYANDALAPGQHVSLVSGIYILNSSFLSKPLKFVVGGR